MDEKENYAPRPVYTYNTTQTPHKEVMNNPPCQGDPELLQIQRYYSVRYIPNTIIYDRRRRR